MNNQKKQIGEASVKSLMPQLKIIAKQWDLKLSSLKQFKIAKKILINSVLNN